MTDEVEDLPVTERLQDLVIDSASVSDYLGELARLSARELSGATEVLCGVTLRRRRSTTTVASSSQEARQLDEIQQIFGDGPCLYAMRTGETTVLTDARTESRWPGYTKAMAERGYFSVLGVPMELEDGASAALNFFARPADAFGSDAIRAAQSYANQASKALRLAIHVWTQRDLTRDLKAAMESRTTIDLAVGIMMGQNRCTQAEAMAILTKASNGRNVKLSALAQDIVNAIGNAPVTTHFDH